MTAYYNEFDPFAAAWLRELIKAGHIAPGVVDERSIVDVRPDELAGFTQCHFFAGIGVWSYALRRAGWPDSKPVWTGSCPCQPFSAAGKGSGFDDERHLWPHFHWLIAQCRPATVFGEQVASKDGLAWLDLVQADLEGSGYTSGAIDTCAAGFGAPHIRQRLYWVADAEHDDRRADFAGWRPKGRTTDGRCGAVSVMDDTGGTGLEGQRGGSTATGGRNATLRPVAATGEPGGMADDTGGRLGKQWGAVGTGEVRHLDGGRDTPGRMADADGAGARRNCGAVSGAEDQSGAEYQQSTRAVGGLADAEGRRHQGEPLRQTAWGQAGGNASNSEPCSVAVMGWTGPTNGLWRDADWLHCRDAKWRAVEPGTFPLAHGAAARVGRLRGYGNAIVAPAAQAFIEAYCEATGAYIDG